MAEEGLYEDGLTCVPTSPRTEGKALRYLSEPDLKELLTDEEGTNAAC